jgi:hypothetical protein
MSLIIPSFAPDPRVLGRPFRVEHADLFVPDRLGLQPEECICLLPVVGHKVILQWGFKNVLHRVIEELLRLSVYVGEPALIIQEKDDVREFLHQSTVTTLRVSEPPFHTLALVQLYLQTGGLLLNFLLQFIRMDNHFACQGSNKQDRADGSQYEKD